MLRLCTPVPFSPARVVVIGAFARLPLPGLNHKSSLILAPCLTYIELKGIEGNGVGPVFFDKICLSGKRWIKPWKRKMQALMSPTVKC